MKCVKNSLELWNRKKKLYINCGTFTKHKIMYANNRNGNISVTGSSDLQYFCISRGRQECQKTGKCLIFWKFSINGNL